jgi:hypothetical protein
MTVTSARHMIRAVCNMQKGGSMVTFWTEGGRSRGCMGRETHRLGLRFRFSAELFKCSFFMSRVLCLVDLVWLFLVFSLLLALSVWSV